MLDTSTSTGIFALHILNLAQSVNVIDILLIRTRLYANHFSIAQ